LPPFISVVDPFRINRQCGAGDGRSDRELSMKVAVDTSMCIGSGTCALTAPAVFDQDDGGAVVVLLDDSPPEVEHEAVRLAVRSCPAAVIRVVQG
jgi:ferredoxin